jgi:hypothetical protein
MAEPGRWPPLRIPGWTSQTDVKRCIRATRGARGLRRPLGAAINVGEIYAHLVRDLHAGTYSTPGFEHALHNARLIEAVNRAAERGERQTVTSQVPEQIETRLVPSEKARIATAF